MKYVEEQNGDTLHIKLTWNYHLKRMAVLMVVIILLSPLAKQCNGRNIGKKIRSGVPQKIMKSDHLASFLTNQLSCQKCENMIEKQAVIIIIVLLMLEVKI